MKSKKSGSSALGLMEITPSYGNGVHRFVSSLYCTLPAWNFRDLADDVIVLSMSRGGPIEFLCL